MKKAVFILWCFVPFSLLAQISDLVGTWTWIERTQLEFGRLPWTTTEDEFKAEGHYVEMILMEDGKTKNIAKYNDTDTIKGWGTWKASKDTLTIGGSDERSHPINWTYQLQEDKLILTLYSPDRQNKIVNTWRRKQE
jgi:hypothetical protein